MAAYGKLTSSLKENIKIFFQIFTDSMDFICRDFAIGSSTHTDAAVLYIDGIANINTINNEILSPLIHHTKLPTYDIKALTLDFLEHSSLTVGKLSQSNKVEDLTKDLLSGYSILLVDEIDEAIVVDTRGGEQRSIEEPVGESVMNGPRDGFTESMQSNICLIRRRIKHPDLKLKKFVLGEKTNTDVAIMYMKDIAKEEVVEEIEHRIIGIKTDAILNSNYIFDFICDNPKSPFSQIDTTERPDKAAAVLLEGKVVIIVDGTPIVSILPAVLLQFYQSPDDYYSKSFYGSLKRIYRFFSFIISITLPGIYLALITYHAHLIPTQMLEVLAEGRAEVPFPAVVEILIMQFMIDLLKEANIRLPTKLSQTIGIVGAIVIGQSAVEANLVSPAMIIIVATTTIASHTTPRYSTTHPIKIIRYVMILAAGTLGIYGVWFVWVWLIIHLCGLESFGSPYLSPFAPLKLKDLKDSLIRLSINNLKTRPSTPQTTDVTRVGKEGKHSDE